MSTFDKDILGRLAEATTEDLKAALSAIKADVVAYRGVPATTVSADALAELSAAATALADELTGRAATGQKADDAFAAIDAATALADDVPDDTADKGGPTGQADVNATHDGPGGPADGTTGTTKDTKDDAPEGDDGDGTDGDGDQDGADAVTASGRRKLGSGRSNATNTGAPAVAALPTVTMRTTAAAGLNEVAPGSTLDRQGLAVAFADRARSVFGNGRSSGGRSDRYKVATVRTEFPAARALGKSVDAFANIERVESVVDRARALHARDNASTALRVRSGPQGANALTAAGLCAPLETLYDIRVIGDTDRPIRDALVRFGADRGGIQYRPALDGTTQTGGMGVWTVADDEDPTPTPKACVEIDCPGILTAEVEAIYQCLTFSNMSTRFDPEQMDATIRAQAIAHARFAENRLYGQLLAGSKTLYSAKLLGATRDVLATLDKVIAYYRNVHRLADETPLRWIAPLWARYMMRADITRQMVGDGLQSLAVTDGAIQSWLTERNVNVTWHLDGIDPADITLPDPDVVVPAQFYTLALTGTAVPEFPDAISSLMFAEGDWIHLDGGTLDLGVVRDSGLNGDNRFQTFSESFEFPAFRGIESLHLVIQADPTGQSAATADTSAVSD